MDNLHSGPTPRGLAPSFCANAPRAAKLSRAYASARVNRILLPIFVEKWLSYVNELHLHSWHLEDCMQGSIGLKTTGYKP